MFKISYCSFTFKLKEKKKVPLEWVGNISKKGGLIKKGQRRKRGGGIMTLKEIWWRYKPYFHLESVT